jgi:hypothetical protein
MYLYFLEEVICLRGEVGHFVSFPQLVGISGPLPDDTVDSGANIEVQFSRVVAYE